MQGFFHLPHSIQRAYSAFVPSPLHLDWAASKEGDISALYCQWEWWFREDLSGALGVDLERVTLA